MKTPFIKKAVSHHSKNTLCNVHVSPQKKSRPHSRYVSALVRSFQNTLSPLSSLSCFGSSFPLLFSPEKRAVVQNESYTGSTDMLHKMTPLTAGKIIGNTIFSFRSIREPVLILINTAFKRFALHILISRLILLRLFPFVFLVGRSHLS